jgi:hypothetical protein
MSEPPEARREEGPTPRVPEGRDALRDFPRLEVPLGSMVWRVHTKGEKPWYFSSNGRFGLSPQAGTCYVAQDPLTSICETVIRGRTQVEPADLQGRTIRSMPLPRAFSLADTPAAVHFGLGRRFSTDEPYDRCREWAAALHGNGFGGVAYWPSHDPRRGDRLSYALFDSMGARRWKVGGRPDDLDSALWTSRIEAELNIKVVRPPDDPELPFTEEL